MKYKVGDKVRIKSLDWYNKNKSKSHGTVACGGKCFEYDMGEWCGKTMTIIAAHKTCYSYIMKEDGRKHFWTDEMIEGLVEEEVDLIPKFGEYSDNEPLDIPTMTTDFIKEHGFPCPNGYIFKDENGNEILTSKIILEKKKNEYPKTYEECCKVMGINHTNDLDICEHCDYKTEITYYEDSLLEKIEALYRLRICRDAYWKIAGEEIGLGKPWEPDWSDYENIKYIIGGYDGEIGKDQNHHIHKILAFSTAEMRDVFYENFKKEIELVKELL